MSTTTTQQIALRARRATTRWWAVTGLSAAALLVLYAALPALGIRYPTASATLDSLYRPADTVLAVVDVTTILVVVAALTVIAVVRKLPYGIGAVLMLCVGASLTSALIRPAAGLPATAATSWLADHVTHSSLPDGRVVAVASVVAAASLVAPAALRPAVIGLGTTAVGAVALAAIVTASATVVGIAGALAITAAWWGLAGVVMAHSPLAAAREAKNPLDTAALMLRRR